MRIFVLGAGITFGLDRISKLLALHYLDPFQSVPVWPPVFQLTLVRNTGVAFGLFKNAGGFFAAASLLSAALIFLYVRRQSRRSKTRLESLKLWAWSAVAGGALGNALDRVRYGAVIDFLDFRVWPVFNLADSAIVCGVACIAWSAFVSEKSSS